MDTRKFLDLFERGKTGKKVDKSDWDMDYIIDNVMDLVEEYEFDWDKEVLIPEDDALFADMFKAARELLIRTGIYNMSTGRIMQLSPEEIDLVLLPCVAFDRCGHRLGHGAGYYDRYLPQTHAAAVAVAFEAQKLPRVSADRFDRSMDAIVTEERVY